LREETQKGKEKRELFFGIGMSFDVNIQRNFKEGSGSAKNRFL